MTRDIFIDLYFDWMYQLVCDDQYQDSYCRLLSHLHDREFIYILEMDGNRATDGVDLRYRFAYDCGYNYSMVDRYLGNRPCSILEMMVALALKCEENIMVDPDVGDRTGLWFWDMVASLGLSSMTDSEFDIFYVDDVLDRFLNREYRRNGEGGLFTVRHCRYDLRTAEIWYQMNWYLNDI